MVNAVNAVKKSRPAPIVPWWFSRTISLMFGPGRSFTLAALVVAGFTGGAWALWQHVEKHVESSPDYLVKVDQIAITPQPEWVRSDVRAEAFRTACLPDRPMSSLDDGLSQRIAMAFMLHPWVAKATVTKKAGARVNVDLVYRQPVCMVEVPNGSSVDLLAVDSDGIWLPGEDFSQKQKESYPCLAGVDHRPIQPVGHAWGDARVLDGAAIAKSLLPVWSQLKLYRIQAASVLSPGDRGPTYELYTRAGTRIVWGFAAASSILGEPSPEEKVARLTQYASAHGSLDAGPSFDVRKLPTAGKEKK
jgi:hypothetical protein